MSPNMRIRLMLTCLCDAFYGEVGIAAAKVLEHAGCEVAFPEDQTCCGQPPFNSGDWSASKQVAKHCLSVFEGSEPVVVPSASCAAMLRDGYPMMGLTPPPTFELSEFLLKEVGIDRWPLEPQGVTQRQTVAFHRSCHGRAIHLDNSQERLLGMVAGLELAPIAHFEQCCGFGGAFSATHGKLSEQIGLDKLQSVIDTGASVLVGGDMGCLMHLGGLIKRHNLPLKTQHYAQILAEAIPK